MRVLIHPGFHKTGTTSLQRGAHAQRAILNPRLRMVLPHDLEQLNHLARRYSLGATARRLTALEEASDLFAASLDRSDTRPLLISSEHLCGLIPGRKTVRSYAAAPDLVAAFVTSVARHLPEADLTVWFSTRAPSDWLRSVYWQNLRGMRITEDLPSYAERLAPAAELDRVVSEVRSRLGGAVPVVSTALETFGASPLGPLGVVLDLMGVSKEGLTALPVQNKQPAEAAELLLSLNRSDLDDEALGEAKAQVLRRLRQTGKTRQNRPAQAASANS